MTDMQVPFQDLRRDYFEDRQAFTDAFTDTLDSGWYILGKQVEAFETAFAEYTGSRFCVGVASGTDAITLGLMAAGIQPGDEVITTDVTAFPTITAIVRTGAVPVTVDINPKNGLIDPENIGKAITQKTRAIVPVHLYGQSCDMDAIAGIATDKEIFIIEDCAQSVSATYRDTHTGNFGFVGCFSFYPTKNLGCMGDGGALITNSETTIKLLKQLRNYGQTDRYTHALDGMNSRLDEVQAAILNIKLKKLDVLNRRRQEIVSTYLNELKNVEFLSNETYGKSSHHLFVIRTNNRDTLSRGLTDKGVGNLVHYPIPIHQQKAFRGIARPEYPHAELFTSEILSLPCFPQLTDAELEYVVSCVNALS